MGPTAARRMVGPECHHHPRTDTVTKTDRHRGKQQAQRVMRQGQQHQSRSHDEHRRHCHPASAHLVHDLAGRIKQQHVDAARKAIDQRGHRRFDAQMIGPQRDSDLPRGSHRSDQHHADTQRQEHQAVIAQDRQDRWCPVLGRERVRHGAAGFHGEIGHAHRHRARNQQRRNANAVRTNQTVGVNRRRRHEGTDEHADAHAAPQRGQSPGTERDWHHLGKVALPREAENSLRHADHETTGRKRSQMPTPPAQRNRQSTPDRGHDDGPAFATVCGDHRRRNVAEQGTNADQGHQQGRHGDRGTQITRRQRNHRQDRPFAEPEQNRRREDRYGEAPQGEFSRGQQANEIRGGIAARAG